MNLDRETQYLFGGTLGILTVASIIGWVLKARITSEGGRKVVENLVSRTNASGTPAEEGRPKVTSPDPAATSRWSACPW